MTRPIITAGPVLAVTLALLSACGSDAAAPGGGGPGGEVTVVNCGEEVTYPETVDELFAYDPGIISIALAAGARDQITAVAAASKDEDLLRLAYGDQIDGLNEVTEQGPTLENVVAAQPDVVFAGWNYGFSESRGLTPEILAGHDIGVYQLTEACRQTEGEAQRGTMDPWDALDTDLRNIGIITGNADAGAAAADEVAERVDALRALPAPQDAPTVFLVDSTSDTILSSGSFGGPQGIIDAAGARNATEDVADTWTSISWERLAAEDPDVIAFVEYGEQTVEDKIAALKAHPASRGLKAVRENRFVNLPYGMWVSSPLNVDAAETIRAVLEKHGLVPHTGLTPGLDVSELGLGGNDWL
ncbi:MULTISPECIES: ABC transporter substrate-binding protein [unclassified Dietzia]|uniref:ABC transporter substrate-binding protein n=1 Tax=unclassified Dietzia TaxID=2617939 RepID=UPI000D225793|nr:MULTISPECIES: ABC transporter substrate-binding protein [unclassified Dietzia]AVZ38995.1 iron transporter [Dietzia sp. JS16-p6b]QGW24158.1 putative ABC transporter substrate binding protein [Dietzia sp. DQ12-45-1b]